MIRAFRDTWELGIHSYLTYLSDRLLLARDLLTNLDRASCKSAMKMSTLSGILWTKFLARTILFR